MVKKSPKHTIEILGETYKGKSKNELISVDNADITLRQLNDLLRGDTRKLVHDTKTGEVEVIDVRNANTDIKPLLKQTFEKFNKEFLRKITHIDNIDIVKEISSNKYIKAQLNIQITYDISSEKNVVRKILRGIEDRHGKMKNKKFKIKDLQKIAEKFAGDYLHNIPDAFNIRVKILHLLSKTGKKIEYTGMKLRDNNPLMFDWFKVTKIKDGNCTRNYLLKKYGKKISPNTINKLGDEGGVSPDELNDFCKKYRILYICYDINCNIIISHTPEIKSKDYSALNIIAYNNHIYPIDSNEQLKSFKDGSNKKIPSIVKIIKSVLRKIEKILRKGIVPVIYNSGINIIGVKFRNKLYVQDEEYKNCIDIAKEYGIFDKLHDVVGYNYIGILLSNLFLKKTDLQSFFPQSSRFIKSGYMYHNDEIDGNFITIDKNKCYSYSLMTLPYLITIDYMTAKINKYPKDIRESYMYIAKPKYSTILLPNTNMYSGYHLEYCLKEGVEFELLEEISTHKKKNKYKKMIKSLYEKIDGNIAKQIINRMIGTFENSENVRDIFEIKKIGIGDEIDASEGYIVDIGDYKLMFDNVGHKCNVLTKKPIAIQIKDNSRIILYEKMKKLGLTDTDIKQIHTDSITFREIEDDVINQIINDDIDTTIDTWKYEQYKERNVNERYNDPDLSFYIDNMKDCVLVNSYAGCGKTYDIINNLIPKLKDYIVLSPTHASLQEYRNKEINCEVIQTYMFSNSVPENDTVIVDEIGMVDRCGHYVILKCLELGKKVYLYGDFKQLLPPSEKKPLNSKHYIDYLATEQKELKTNYRNDFTTEYYDKLIAMKDKSKILNEIKKYSINSIDDFKEGMCIIAYKNETVDKYNKIILDKLGLNEGDNGTHIICKTNKLTDLGIYNNLTYKIINNDDNFIIKQYDIQTIEGKVGINYYNKEYTISKKQYKTNFKLGYATTIYAKQGGSVMGYYFPEEDIKHIDGKTLYTIISRIKTK